MVGHMGIQEGTIEKGSWEWGWQKGRVGGQVYRGRGIGQFSRNMVTRGIALGIDLAGLGWDMGL